MSVDGLHVEFLCTTNLLRGCIDDPDIVAKRIVLLQIDILRHFVAYAVTVVHLAGYNN